MTVLAVPVVVVLLVLIRLLSGNGDEGPGSPQGEVTGPPPTGRADPPILTVDAPPVPPGAEASCPALMAALPRELTGERLRPVQSDSPYVHAWGDPPIVLVCGSDRPAGLVPGAGLLQINGVQWFVDTGDPDAVVWTAVDRPVYLQVTVPPETDSAPVAVLGPVIEATLPAREPDPGG